jgi:hypothetical protein
MTSMGFFGSLLGFAEGAHLNFADEALLALGEEHFDDVGDVLGLEEFGGVFLGAVGEVGGDAAGADEADADAVFAEVYGHAAGEALQAPFGGAIEGGAGLRLEKIFGAPSFAPRERWGF